MEDITVNLSWPNELDRPSSIYVLPPNQAQLSVRINGALFTVKRGTPDKTYAVAKPEDTSSGSKLLVEYWKSGIPESIFCYPLEKVMTEPQTIQLLDSSGKHSQEFRFSIGKLIK